MIFNYDYEIPNKGKFYLNEIIEPSYYERWFYSKNINVLNKSLCGNGGTTGFIEWSKKNVKGILILVPNVSITKSKELQYKSDPNVCCVYGGCESIDPNSLVVISTYDQFPKLQKTLMDYGMDWDKFWSGRCVVIDEYHKLVDENQFRDICYKVTEMIKTTKNSVVLMSATPHWGYVDFLRDYIKEKEVITYTVKYDSEYDKQINRRIQVYPIKKDLTSIIKKVHINERFGSDRQICIFYSNLKEVKDILNKIGDNTCEVLCSSSNKNNLGEYYSNEFNPNKKVHFMTSAYFTGHDIDTEIDVCIIIGSQQFQCTSYSQREIKQMLGRFRGGLRGVFVFVLERSVNKIDYNKVKNRYDLLSKNLKEIEDNVQDCYVLDFSSKWKQEILNLQDTLEKYKNWSSVDNVCNLFKDMREDMGEYVIQKCEIKDLVKGEMNEKLSLKESKEKILNGETLSYDQYQYNYMLTKFYQTFGGESLMKSSITKIKDWYKMSTCTENVDLNILTPTELYEV